jgi:hypothetical protein
MNSLTKLNGQNLSRYLLEKKIIEQTNGLDNLDELNLVNNQIASNLIAQFRLDLL